MQNNLEYLWRKINFWGIVIGMFGVLISVIGLIIGLLSFNWTAFQVGIVILILGVITWVFPFIHVTFRMKKVNQYTNNILQDKENKWIEGLENFKTGKELLMNKENDEALIYFDKAIECGFEDEVYENRGMCLQALGYDLDAIGDFDKAIGKASDDANLYFLRSLSKSSVGNIEGSVDDLKKAVELSKIPNEINKTYDLAMQEKGYDSVADCYEFYLKREEETLKEAIEESNMSEELKEKIWGKEKGERTYPHWKKINKKRR